LNDERHNQTRRATQYHYVGLFGVGVGVATIIAAAVLLMLGHLSASIASMVTSLVINGMSALLFAREDRAHARVRDRYEELDALNRTGFLLEICATIESPVERDVYRMKIIDRGLAFPAQGRPVIAPSTKARRPKTHETSKTPGC
jgi:hypothetical protein